MSFTLNDFDDVNKMQAIKQFADQLDHFALIIDCENRTVLINEMYAKLCGFSCADEMMSQRLSVNDYKCPAVEIVEVLYAENKHIIDTMQSRTYITNLLLADQKLYLTYGTKKPIIDLQGNVIGITMLFSKITANPSINLAYVLSQSTKYYQNKKQSEQFSFLVTEDVKELKITPKQMECLFYLLRGKSRTEIAALLNRSPRTIDTHTEALKLTFNCDKKSELIEKALDSGCLNYLPKSLINHPPKTNALL